MRRLTATKSLVKHAQRESFFLKEISVLFLQLTVDEPALKGASISRVSLSPDGGLCTVFFYTDGGKEAFDALFSTLILYKPSLRTTLARSSQKRYTPDILFKYDMQIEKQHRVESLLDKLKDEDL